MRNNYLKQCFHFRIILFSTWLLIIPICYAGLSDVTPSVQTELGETMLCTTVAKVVMEHGKPLLAGNPLENISALPTVCQSTASGRINRNDGAQYFLLSGWQILQVSHNVVLVPTSETNKSEVLISALFVLQRAKTWQYAR